MNRTEKALWNRIRRHLPGVSDRVENAAGPGFPDAYADHEKGSYWVELKVTSESAASDKGRVVGLLRPSQVVWLRRHVREGASAFMIVGHKRGLVIHRVVYRDGSVDVEKLFSLTGPFDLKNKLYFNQEMRRGLQHG